MERVVQIWKLAILLFIVPAICFAASGDTVIDGMPVETLTADKVVRTDGDKILVSSSVDSSDIVTLTNGSNADALHLHTLDSGVTDVTATAAEINQALDGIGVTVTDTNLDTLTDGSDADALHTHSNGVYRLAQGSNIATYAAPTTFVLLVIEATASIDVTEGGGPPAFVLSGGTFSMEDGDTLSLIYDGTNWVEIGRSFAF